MLCFNLLQLTVISEALEITFDYCCPNYCYYYHYKQSFLYVEVVYSIHSLATMDIKQDMV